MTDPFIQHHGVKGMRWGVRRDATGARPIAVSLHNSKFGQASVRRAQEHGQKQTAKANYKSAKADYKTKVSQEKANFYQTKANNILKESMHDTDTLVLLRHQAGTTIVTGREFVDYMSRGGFMDIKATDVYARKTANNTYEYNSTMNTPFVSSIAKPQKP